MWRFLSSLFIVNLAAFPSPAVAQISATQPRASTVALTATEIFKSVSDGIATIQTPLKFGSGIVVDPSGVVLTNLHVIEGATKVSVKLANGDVYDDVLISAFDARRDLVLLKVGGFALKSVPLGNSDDTQTGNRVYAIGAPRGLELTISEGIVSAIRDSGEGFRVIQTTAPISPGSSGGGLFDIRARLIGVTTFRVADGENLNFAVPINYARGMMAAGLKLTLKELQNRLMETGRTAESPARSAEPPSQASGQAQADGSVNVSPTEVTVMLFGDSGHLFQGSCTAVIGPDRESRSLAGVLPANFTFRANSLTCEFRKQTEGGLLHVQFVRDGRSVKQSSTSSPYGFVSLSINAAQ